MAILDEFLTSISGFLRAKDALQLKSWLVVEPPVDDQYYQLAQELKVSFRDGDHLERRITKLIPENDDGKADEGDVWPGFLVFMKDYLEFWRDVNFEDLLETHSQLSGLVKYVYLRGYLEHLNNGNLQCLHYCIIQLEPWHCCAPNCHSTITSLVDSCYDSRQSTRFDAAAAQGYGYRSGGNKENAGREHCRIHTEGIYYVLD